MPLIEAERNAIADFEVARLGYVSLHTADPGLTGANEASGGAPAYIRKALVAVPASGGNAPCAQVTFDVPAGVYTHGGTWSAETGGVFRGGNLLGAPQTIAGQNVLRLTVSVLVTST